MRYVAPYGLLEAFNKCLFILFLLNNISIKFWGSFGVTLGVRLGLP
jgi:hypothetical protein